MMSTLHAIGNWLYWFFGISGTGSHYGFWSGTGSDIGEVTVIGGAWMVYRKHNCHAPGCWRIGKHPLNGHYVVCRKHHPEIPDKLTIEFMHNGLAKEGD